MIDQRAIAIFGGAFDPPHFGHVEVVRLLLAFPAIKSVFVVPSCRPPHKNTSEPFGHRFTMCHRVFAPYAPDVLILNEDNGKSPTYTCDVLKTLPNWGKQKYVLVLGTDEARSLWSWKSPEKIFSHAKLVIMERPGLPEESADEDTKRRLKGLSKVVQEAIINATRIQVPDAFIVSSTSVRQALKEGRAVSNLVPAPALDYIREHSLYGI